MMLGYPLILSTNLDSYWNRNQRPDNKVTNMGETGGEMNQEINNPQSVLNNRDEADGSLTSPACSQTNYQPVPNMLAGTKNNCASEVERSWFKRLLPSLLWMKETGENRRYNHRVAINDYFVNVRSGLRKILTNCDYARIAAQPDTDAEALYKNCFNPRTRSEGHIGTQRQKRNYPK